MNSLEFKKAWHGAHLFSKHLGRTKIICFPKYFGLTKRFIKLNTFQNIAFGGIVKIRCVKDEGPKASRIVLCSLQNSISSIQTWVVFRNKFLASSQTTLLFGNSLLNFK